MRNNNCFFVLISMLIFFGFFGEDVDDVDLSSSKKVSINEQKKAEKEILIDCVRTANFEIHLVHGGYIGNGPATEIVRITNSFSYPNKNYTGNSGLVANASFNVYRMQFNSIFGKKYDCHIWTRRMLDRAIIRDEDGHGQLYLAKTERKDDKTLSVTLNLTTNDELEELDKTLFATKYL